MLLPSSMYELYIFDRLLLQFPIILVVVVLSFWRRFIQHRAYIFAGLLIALSYSNYWLIWVCWEEHSFIFPYEGTILYAFFCVFALGIAFKLALAANVINILGFFGVNVGCAGLWWQSSNFNGICIWVFVYLCLCPLSVRSQRTHVKRNQWQAT